MVTKKKSKLLLLAFLINNIYALDYCSEVNTDFQIGDYTTYDNIINCYKNFPFNKTTSIDIIENLKKMWKISVFSDDTLDPPNKENLNLKPYDIIKQLNTLKEKKFKTDFDFQQELTKSFIPISDGHTVYQSGCYNQVTFVQPLDVFSYVINNKQVLYFTDIIDTDSEIITYVKNNYKLDLTNYRNLEIIKINNINSIRYMINFSKENIFHAKDVSSKFSYATSHTSYDPSSESVETVSGEFNQRKYVYPKEKFINYTVIKNGKTLDIKIPWIIKVNKYWIGENSKDYWENTCLNKYYNEKIVEKKSNNNIKIQIKKSAIKTNIVWNYSPGTNFYQINNITGVINLSTFSPYRTNIDKYINGFKTQIDNFKKNGIKNIIVDASDNNGGTMCMAYYAISSILNKHVQFKTDIKLTPLTLNLQNKVDYFESTEYVNPKTNKVYNKNDKFLLPGIKLNRGNRTQLYSQQFQDFCPIFNKTSNKTFDNIIIMTNGQCGSSCGLSMLGLKFLSNNKNIKTVTVGGLYNNQMQLTSYIGGQEYLIGNLLDDIETAGLGNKSYSPYKINYKYTFAITFREIRYPNIKSTNLDYQWNPSDYRIYWNKENTKDPLSIYNEIDKLF